MRMRRLLLFLFLLLSLPAAGFSQSLEIPLPREGDQIIRHSAYTLNYREEYEQADWVAYELTASETEGTFERTDNFREDPLVLTGSASGEDYKGSGFDRGHLAPAGDMKLTGQTMSDSFYLSNMSPQNPSFNRGIWKNLEELVRDWARQYGSLFIVTGPILTKEDLPRIGTSGVAVPVYFYKVILVYDESVQKSIGFVLPNKKGEFPLSSYAVTVDDVEILTGIDFFPGLPDPEEEEIESVIEKETWDFYPAGESSAPLREQNLSPTAVTAGTVLPYWINSSNSTRHNSRCRYYGKTSHGYYTEEKQGDPCGLCGG